MKHVIYLLLAVLIAISWPSVARADVTEAMASSVSVLPVWPGRPQGGLDVPPGQAPEGSGVVVATSKGPMIATAWHVIQPAQSVDVRLRDGRILEAQIVGFHEATDIALLEIDDWVRPYPISDEPTLGSEVCAIGNAYGFGLSVTCGVVSAKNVTTARFNAIEDFIQTDAAANPGSSGGALVNRDGELVGMMSAIFASGADTNIGMNFAISSALLLRIAEDLADDGAVSLFDPGWRLEPLGREERRTVSGAKIAALEVGGAAAKAGMQAGEIIHRVGGRLIRTPRDLISVLSLLRPGERIGVTLLSDGQTVERFVSFTVQTEQSPDCVHPKPVCDVRQAVFPVSSYDPLASATRIGPDLLVTNRHVVGNQSSAFVMTPAGQVEARVIPSSYDGDLVLLLADRLPADGLFLSVIPSGSLLGSNVFVVGADGDRREVRVFTPGKVLRDPAPQTPLGRLHVSAEMQPGVSGGALLNDQGRLVGIAVGGGSGRYEALPADQVARLLEGVSPSTDDGHNRLGEAYVACNRGLDQFPLEDPASSKARILETCLFANNAGQLLDAARIFGQAREFADAEQLARAAVDQVPHSVNARISLLVSLQMQGSIDAMVPHATWLVEEAHDDPAALRFAIQAGVRSGNYELAERAARAMSTADPRQAQAAFDFIEAAKARSQ